jgi:3D (Asp-Asp-Asp) domain-containing protein
MLRSAAVPDLLHGRRGRTLACLLAVAIGLGVAAASAADRRPVDTSSLRHAGNSLAARRHQALLDLYASTTRLANAQRRLATLQSETVRIRAQRELVDREVTIAEHTLSFSQTQLARQLRALYVQGQPDPLAVVLGATSLEDALLELDAIERTSNLSSQIIQQTRAARETLTRVRSVLAARSARLEVLRREAAASVVTLTSVRDQRAALVGSIKRKEQLTRRQLARLDAAARAAQAKSEALTSTAGAALSAGDASPDPTDAGGPAPAAVPGSLTVTATGYSLTGRTATGLPVGWGVAAVDPSVIPLGTRLTVPGYGEAVAADIGSGVQGATIDLWFPTLALARAWGRRTVVITLH